MQIMGSAFKAVNLDSPSLMFSDRNNTSIPEAISSLQVISKIGLLSLIKARVICSCVVPVSISSYFFEVDVALHKKIRRRPLHLTHIEVLVYPTTNKRA